MRTKTALLTLGVALLVATAGCSQTLGSTNTSPVSTPTANQTVQVAASGSVAAEPNQAIVRVAVVATADDVATARQRLTENVSRMRDALAEIGVNSSQITTAHYDISQQHHPRERKQQTEPKYRAIHAFQFTLSDLDRVGTVIDTAVTNGANRVDGVQFSLSQQKRQSLRNQALQNAMGNAREKAETLAGAAALEVVSVQRIRTGRTDFHGREAAMATATAASGGTDIASGTITVSVRVQVTYNASAAT